MDCRHKNARFLFEAALAFTLLLNATIATDAAEGRVEKWRPKDGVYASPDANFSGRCLDFGDAIIELAEKSVSGGEEECKILKLTDTGAGAITFDMSCTDIENQMPHKEIMLLKKIDDKTIFLRETQNGKFGRPGGTFSYCGEKVQRECTLSRRRRGNNNAGNLPGSPPQRFRLSFPPPPAPCPRCRAAPR